VIDFRLYRLAFAPTLLAVIAVMFSLEGTPDAIQPAASPGLEEERAAVTARQVVELAPDRQPGSSGDNAVADLVAERFADIPAGAVTGQEFDGEFEGEEVSLRNVLLTLPGGAGSTVVVFAPRDSARGAGAASSAAATGVLIELAEALGNRERAKTFVLASTSGSAAGAAGARALLDGLPERDSVEAMIAITQPGAAESHPPFVIASSTSTRSGPVQLARTAEEAVNDQAQEPSPTTSPFTQLARLAFPSGVGPQAPLIAEGVDAIAISAAGERPLAESEDELDQLSGATLDAFGRAVESTVHAVDESTGPLAHGPGTHLELSDNLVPGWTIALLALALMLPAAVAAVDSCARAARMRLGLGAGLAWAAGRSLPFVGALLMLYALAIVGLVPSPDFPFDPALYELGVRSGITLVLVVLTGVASVVLLRRTGVGGAGAPPAALPAIGLVVVAACLLAWLANPYLGLLLVPAAHAWLLADGAPGPTRGALAVGAAALACVPVIAALAAVSSTLDLGAVAPWTFALMIADSQIGLATMVSACFVAGALVGGAALCLRRPGSDDR
jgi:Peptidase family M28